MGWFNHQTDENGWTTLALTMKNYGGWVRESLPKKSLKPGLGTIVLVICGDWLPIIGHVIFKENDTTVSSDGTWSRLSTLSLDCSVLRWRDRVFKEPQRCIIQRQRARSVPSRSWTMARVFQCKSTKNTSVESQWLSTLGMSPGTDMGP